MEVQKPGGHLDQLIRQTRAHHVELSSMADSKANMMMTVSSLLIPLSIRYVVEPQLRWPAVTLILFCAFTVVLSAYASMPKIPLTRHKEKPPDLDDPRTNLLFFGSFFNFPYKDFEKAMENVLNDHSKSYEVQIREIYIVGRYLAAYKYRFVRMAYLTFISGICSTVLIFFIQTVFF